jgi:hypothetical protein
MSPTLREILDRPARPASVLLALLERPAGPMVLFTERAAHLKDHAGQISLPGGRLIHGETPADAALREANEEVGPLVGGDSRSRRGRFGAGGGETDDEARRSHDTERTHWGSPRQKPSLAPARLADSEQFLAMWG